MWIILQGKRKLEYQDFLLFITKKIFCSQKIRILEIIKVFEYNNELFIIETVRKDKFFLYWGYSSNILKWKDESNDSEKLISWLHWWIGDN